MPSIFQNSKLNSESSVVQNGPLLDIIPLSRSCLHHNHADIQYKDVSSLLILIKCVIVSFWAYIKVPVYEMLACPETAGDRKEQQTNVRSHTMRLIDLGARAPVRTDPDGRDSVMDDKPHSGL